VPSFHAGFPFAQHHMARPRQRWGKRRELKCCGRVGFGGASKNCFCRSAPSLCTSPRTSHFMILERLASSTAPPAPRAATTPPPRRQRENNSAHARSLLCLHDFRFPVHGKRSVGRPPAGQDPVVALRLPKDQIARLDKWAKAQGYTRSEAIRKAIRNLAR
jgi:hypothetical protein